MYPFPCAISLFVIIVTIMIKVMIVASIITSTINFAIAIFFSLLVSISQCDISLIYISFSIYPSFVSILVSISHCAIYYSLYIPHSHTHSLTVSFTYLFLETEAIRSVLGKLQLLLLQSKSQG